MFRVDEKKERRMHSHPFCAISLGRKWRDRCEVKHINGMGLMPSTHHKGGTTSSSDALVMKIQKEELSQHHMSSTA